MKNIFDSRVISKYISQESLDAYEKDFDAWVSDFSMQECIGRPDHFGIKVEDESALIEVARALKPYCVERKGNTPGLSMRTMHGRKIAVALLKVPIRFKDTMIDCIEVMQPRPHKEREYDIVGIDHMEILNDRLDEIEQKLKASGAKYYVDETNPYKEIMVSFVNKKNERVKFTNKTLEEIVPQQIKDEPERVEIVE